MRIKDFISFINEDYGNNPYITVEDPDVTRAKEEGDDYTLVPDVIEFDAAKTLILVKHDSFLTSSFAKLVGMNVSFDPNNIGEVEKQRLREIFDEIILPSSDLRNKYKQIP